MTLKTLNKNNAFTLIEITAVLFLISIFLMFAFVSFDYLNKKFFFNKEIQNFKISFIEFQQKAITRSSQAKIIILKNNNEILFKNNDDLKKIKFKNFKIKDVVSDYYKKQTEKFVFSIYPDGECEIFQLLLSSDFSVKKISINKLGKFYEEK